MITSRSLSECRVATAGAGVSAANATQLHRDAASELDALRSAPLRRSDVDGALRELRAVAGLALPAWWSGAPRTAPLDESPRASPPPARAAPRASCRMRELTRCSAAQSDAGEVLAVRALIALHASGFFKRRVVAATLKREPRARAHMDAVRRATSQMDLATLRARFELEIGAVTSRAAPSLATLTLRRIVALVASIDSVTAV